MIKPPAQLNPPAPPEQPEEPKLGNIYPGSIGNWLLNKNSSHFFCLSVPRRIFGLTRRKPSLSRAIEDAWVLGVPINFFLEHLFIFRSFGNSDQYDQFKNVKIGA